jgi:hypothetical protein
MARLTDNGIGSNLSIIKEEATTAYNNAITYVNELKNATKLFIPGTVDVTWKAPRHPTLNDSGQLTLIDATFSKPNEVNGSVPHNPINPSYPTIPATPSISFPQPPSYTEPSQPAKPSLDSINLPKYEGTPLPPPPPKLSIDVPKYDGGSYPEFNEEAPEIQLVPPRVHTYSPGQAYTSSLLKRVIDGLMDRLSKGGSGINPDIEKGIWERAYEREELAAQNAIRELNQMEMLGFSLPPGTYLEARHRIRVETNARMAGVSREIAIKQAELELENVKSAYQTATEIEARLLEQNTQIEQRAFDYAKYVTEANVQVYNAQVQAYGLMLETYKSRIAVYDALIRGHLGNVEVYKSRVNAEMTKAQINQNAVEEYKALIQASLASVDVYKAEVDATRALAEVNKLKVDIYGAEIDAYTRQVNAYTAKLDGYKTLVSSEANKIQLYSSQVNAYDVGVRAEISKVNADIETYKTKLQAKSLEWEGYKARVLAETERVKALSETNQTAAVAFEAETKAIEEYNRSLIAQWTADLEQYKAGVSLANDAAKANIQNAISTQSILSDALRTAGQTAAQLSSAAYSAVNYSMSFSQSNSDATSDSVSENTNISV